MKTISIFYSTRWAVSKSQKLLPVSRVLTAKVTTRFFPTCN